MRKVLLLGAALVPAHAALADSTAANNQAYINQEAATTPSQSVTNDLTFRQTGIGNQLGSSGNTVTQTGSGDGAANVFSADQLTNGNLIGFTVGGVPEPLSQSGAGNNASIVQQGGDRNVLGSITQESLLGGGGNYLVVTQTGSGNYVLEITQRNTGRAANLATIRQTGDLNGYPGGYAFSTGASAINGVGSLAQRSYIGLAEAQLSFVFTANGVSAYSGPVERDGATLAQLGGSNLADVATSGTDNSFTVQQNSVTASNDGGNTFTWTATGSSNYAYALQVGVNSASNVVVGGQNTFLVYQAGYNGAGGNGYGNLASWQQGAGAGAIQNFAELVQLGLNNTVTGSQLGSLNVTRAYQRGSGNFVLAMGVGSSNTIDVTQSGSGNSISVVQGGQPRAR